MLSNAPYNKLNNLKLSALPERFIGRPWLLPTPDRIIRSAIIDTKINQYKYANIASVSPRTEDGTSNYFCLNNNYIQIDNFYLKAVKQILISVLEHPNILKIAAFSPMETFYIEAPTMSTSGKLMYLDALYERYYNVSPEFINIKNIWVQNHILWVVTDENILYYGACDDIKTGYKLQPVVKTSSDIVGISWNFDKESPVYYCITVSAGETYISQFIPESKQITKTSKIYNKIFKNIQIAPDGSIWVLDTDNKLALIDVPNIGTQKSIYFYPFDNSAMIGDKDICIKENDYVPFSGSNVVLFTNTNRYERLYVGVLDQPTIPFTQYTDDQLKAYNFISNKLIEGTLLAQESQDIRKSYSKISSSQAAAYYSKLDIIVKPKEIDVNDWTAVKSELASELYNLVSTISLWERMKYLTHLRQTVNKNALDYTRSYLDLPTVVSIDSTDGNVSALTIAGSTCNIIGSVASMLSMIPGVGFFSGAISAVGSILGLMAFLKTQNPNASVNDTHFQLSMKYSEMLGNMATTFNKTIDLIETSSISSVSNFSSLSLCGNLVRNGMWDISGIPTSNLKEKIFEMPLMEHYYKQCCLTYMQAFIPFITGVVLSNYFFVCDMPFRTNTKTYSAHTRYGPFSDCVLLQHTTEAGSQTLLGKDIEVFLKEELGVDIKDIFEENNGWNSIKQYEFWLIDK